MIPEPGDVNREKEVDELKAERLAKTQDPLGLMANSNNAYAFSAPHQDQSSFNQNYLQQPMPNPEDITDPTTAMNIALALMAKAFKLNYSSPTNNNQRISSNPRNRQIAQPGMNMGQDRQMQMVDQNPKVQNIRNYYGLIGVQGNGNQNQIGNGNLVAARAERNAAGQNGNQRRRYNCRGVGHYARNCTVRPRRRDAAYLQTQLLIAQKEEAGIQLQEEEYDLMAAAADLDEIEKVNENCILMICSKHQPRYTELLEPILEPLQVPQNDNDVTSEVTSMEQGGEIVEQHPANFEETRALYDSLYQNLAIEVEKVNSVNRKLKETNADLTTELARFKNQTRCFEISQEKYDKLERCYQQSVYQEQCLSKKINALHLSTDPTTAMNMALALMAKAFKLNYSTPTNNNQRISSNPRNRQIAQPGMSLGQDSQMQMIGGNGGNQFRIQNQIGNGNLVAARAEGNAARQNANQIRCYNCRGIGHYARNCTARPRRRDAAYLQTQLLIAQKEEAGIQLQAEEYDLMAAAADLDEIEEVNANCILMANLQQALSSGTQIDS
nr:hypothetical protein [Tanacetum cinerariifolium]